jgi:hypothetical protein
MKTLEFLKVQRLMQCPYRSWFCATKYDGKLSILERKLEATVSAPMASNGVVTQHCSQHKTGTTFIANTSCIGCSANITLAAATFLTNTRDYKENNRLPDKSGWLTTCTMSNQSKAKLCNNNVRLESFWVPKWCWKNRVELLDSCQFSGDALFVVHTRKPVNRVNLTTKKFFLPWS